jgi:hypothetical protein
MSRQDPAHSDKVWMNWTRVSNRRHVHLIPAESQGIDFGTSVSEKFPLSLSLSIR